MTSSRPDPAPKEFQLHQYRFTAHIRAPEHNPLPLDVDPRRMGIYRELLFNNVESLLSSAFPVIRQILTEEHWQSLVEDFFARRRCTTPLFSEIPQELIAFLQEEREDNPADPPFLVELAHYEWVEMALAISDADRDPLPPLDPNGDLLSGIPWVSALAWSLSYRFPVHRLGPDFQPYTPSGEPTHLLVYRGRDDEVGFLEINAVTQRLIELLKENGRSTGLEALKRIAEELHHPDPEKVVEGGCQILEQLRRRNVLLGTLATDPD